MGLSKKQKLELQKKYILAAAEEYKEEKGGMNTIDVRVRLLVKWIDSKIKNLPKSKKERSKNRLKDGSRIYNICEVYEVGEKIYHSLFKEKGVVIKKKTTNAGLHLIIINFKKRGKITLVENSPPKSW